MLCDTYVYNVRNLSATVSVFVSIKLTSRPLEGSHKVTKDSSITEDV
jgi:hypothetical protein